MVHSICHLNKRQPPFTRTACHHVYLLMKIVSILGYKLSVSHKNSFPFLQAFYSCSVPLETVDTSNLHPSSLNFRWLVDLNKICTASLCHTLASGSVQKEIRRQIFLKISTVLCFNLLIMMVSIRKCAQAPFNWKLLIYLFCLLFW